MKATTHIGTVAVNNVGRNLLIAHMHGPAHFSNILVDDLAIYKRALSDQEVMQLYNATCNDAELVVTSACTVSVPDAFVAGEKVYVLIDGVQHQVAEYTGQTTVEQCLGAVATGLTNLGLTCTNTNGIITIPEWPSNWEWDTPGDIAALDCSGGSVAYRFGFQGQEKDDEIYGATGTSYAFEYRMHDARVGRFLSIDPLAAKYPHNSPYAFAENKVIKFIELEGLETAPNRMDASFNQPAQGQEGTDWARIEGNTYLNQKNSQGQMPGNFFYFNSGRNGEANTYYRQITMNNVATNSTSNSTTNTGAPTQTTATVDGGGLGFASWTATPTSPGAAAATLAGVAAAAPNGATTTAGAPATTTSSVTTQNRAPLVTTMTTVTTAVTIQTNVVSNVQSTIALNYATMGPFTPVGGGPGGIGSTGLLGARFGFVQSGLVSLGVPAGQISLGSTNWGAPASMTGGALNRFSFGITLTTTNVGTTTTTNTTTTSTSLRFTGYTD